MASLLFKISTITFLSDLSVNENSPKLLFFYIYLEVFREQSDQRLFVLTFGIVHYIFRGHML